MSSSRIKGNVVDIAGERIFEGEIHLDNGKITAIHSLSEKLGEGLPFILPGFIDSHVHIESSMLVPSEFARLAVVHGTVATVSDPHEIANVCGTAGVEYMIENGKGVNFKFFFGAPSCVPATGFETAGAIVNSNDVKNLLHRDDILYLSEMMNFPGVIHHDPEVMAKIEAAKNVSKPIDGHAPGLRGDALAKYLAAGISTDHECFTLEEALEKLSLGMKIIIREGSAAKNFDALVGLLHDYPNEIMFCSDDKHPDSLVDGHINQLCKRAVQKGVNVFHVLKAACVNPVLHYRLPTGLMREGDPADFIIAEDLRHFRVKATYINGECVAENGKSRIERKKTRPMNVFAAEPVNVSSLGYAREHLIGGLLPVIEALDGQLITNKLLLEPLLAGDRIVADPTRDMLKLVVVNRYHKSLPAVAFITNFGLKKGAIASSVAHDSHNVIAVGADDESIAHAINLVIAEKGGISFVQEGVQRVLPLAIAGLMSAEDGYEVAKAYTEMDRLAKSAGSTLSAPFMTLSFMALLVIPSLKLSDKGLFDGEKFAFMFQ